MFTTYEADPSYVMIHRADCGQVRKLHADGFVDHVDLVAAQAYAESNGRDRRDGWGHCQLCLKGYLPRHP